MNRSYQMPERPWPGYYLTAYGLAVKNGFVGSEQEWLESLKGETGPQGVSPTVTVTKAGGVTTVTITDATGEHTATIKDGEVTREALEEAIAEHAARSWTLEVTADKWVAGTDTWEEFTGNYKAELTAEGMTAETVIDTVNFVSGDLEAASTWVYYKPGAGTVTLWSRDKPTENFTIRMTEVVV